MDEAIEASIDSVVELPAIDFADLVAMGQEPDVYNPSATRRNDILHTSLEVSFDIPAQRLFGKASLKVKPYFYPVDSLILDAKAFDIKKVAIKNDKGNLKDLNYSYSDYMLRIALDTTYYRNQTYDVFIEYVANPKDVKAEGSSAITDARGLYFIDPNEKDPEKPTQIWTQGETESNSCWFPTFDKPNEKMTHDIKITVPQKYTTLSNGLMTKSVKNSDGTRADTWEMKQQNAPYLVMMAIGEFAIVKDTWGKIPVDYYVEPEFEKHAKAIFGNTPEMIQFFSDALGVKYPWPKYSQVVVRDYVSGAMENTSATLFGEFVQQTPEEMIDQDYEDVIAHELFHHWFGDLVTCESWSNLPLNESFATYGEYLWNEHKYGRDAADLHLQSDLSTYFEESYQKKVDLIRFNYDKREDMFDRHSYQKGGCVLHMLRKAVGDEAFFESLKTYLTDNAYQPAEVHHLRLAFEKVTGEDMNWFFNQWFFDKGHPMIDVSWEWLAEDSSISLTLEQTQNLESTPIYKLPLVIAMGEGLSTRTENIVFTEQMQTFTFKADKKPDYLLVDAEHQLLGQITQQFSPDEARELYLHGSLYRDRFEALSYLLDNASDPGVSEILKLALKDKFWNIRSYVLERLDDQIAQDPEGYKSILMQLAKTDPKSTVRSQAIRKLGFAASEPAVFEIFKMAMNDSSAMVKSSALASMYAGDAEKTIKMIEPLEKTAKGDLLTSIAAIYADAAVPGKLDFLKSAYAGISDPNDRYIFVQLIGRYVISQGEPSISQSISYFEDVATKSSAWFIRLSGIQVLAELQTWYDSKVDEVSSEIQEMIQKGTAVSVVQDKEVEKTVYKKKSTDISVIIDTIRETEKDPNLTRILYMFR
ncbi:MAG: M1 family aminopeptidase [Bacteroidia bacterium]